MKYIAPEAEVIVFASEDVITTSSSGNDLEYGGDV